MRILAATSCLCLLALVAGCSKQWKVLEQSGPPSALRGAGPLTLVWDVGQLELDGHPIDEGLGLLPPAERAELASVLREMRAIYLAELREQMPVRVTLSEGPPRPHEARVEVRLLELERGARGPASGPTRLVMRIDCVVGGDLVDSIRIERRQPPTMQCPSVTERIRLLAVGAAQITARFYESEQERE